jgi:hypothetical protein
VVFGAIEGYWGDLTTAKKEFSGACAVPRRIVGNEIIDGIQVLTFQTPKSRNPDDWPSDTIPYDPFPVIEGYADRANRRVNVIADVLRKFAPLTFNTAEVSSIVDLCLENSLPEQASGVKQQGGNIEQYEDAHFDLGIAYDVAAIVQKLGVTKIELLLEDPEIVIPFFTKVGNIAVARQEDITLYPGLLETIAADIGQARVLKRASVLQSAIQTVLQRQSTVGEEAVSAPQSEDLQRELLELRKPYASC